MVERQPGRPTVEEFTGAAERFIRDDYTYGKLTEKQKEDFIRWIGQLQVADSKQIRDILESFVTEDFYDIDQKIADTDVLYREWQADGGWHDNDLETFILHQLAYYLKVKA
jgi:hypothetical protein